MFTLHVLTRARASVCLCRPQQTVYAARAPVRRVRRAQRHRSRQPTRTCCGEAALVTLRSGHGVDPGEIYRTIPTILSADHLDALRAKFIEYEVSWKSLCDALKPLGCFEPSKVQFERPHACLDNVKRGFDIFD